MTVRETKKSEMALSTSDFNRKAVFKHGSLRGKAGDAEFNSQ